MTLGSSCAVSTIERGNTSALFELSGRPLLIDFPGDVCRKLLQAGVDPLDVKTAVLTHRHVDHLHGLPSFVHECIQLCKPLRAARPNTPGPMAELNLICPESDADLVERTLDLFGLAEQSDLYRVNLHPLPVTAEGETAKGELWDGWRYEAIGGRHGSLAPLGLVIQHDGAGWKLIWSSDTEPAARLLSRASGAQILLHDTQAASPMAAHGDADTLIAMLNEHGWPDLFVPMHLPADDTEIAAIRTELDRVAPDRFRMPDDGVWLLDLRAAT